MNKNDPLHGITLKTMLTELQESIGWEGLSERININCFKSNPSIKSSLTFLRRTPWAREKLENLYLKSHGHKPRFAISNANKANANKANANVSHADKSKAVDGKSPKADPWGTISSKEPVNPWLKNRG